MFVTFCNAAFRFFLALTLLVNGSSGPAIQHTHADGDKPHAHEAAAEHSHRHGHGHHHDHATEAVTNVASHAHVSWFGFEFTVPAPHDSDQTDSAKSDAAFVKLQDDYSPIVPVAMGFFAAIEPIGTADVFGTPRARYAITPAATTLLCDTARHERSGVQRS